MHFAEVSSSECTACVSTRAGPSCCGTGGSWQGNCGSKGDARFDHTWGDGLKACAGIAVAEKAENTVGGVQENGKFNVALRTYQEIVSMGSVVDMATGVTLLVGSMHCLLLLR